MVDNRRAMPAWPPDYADPIVLRLRFVPHAPRQRPFPTQVASKIAWDGYVTDAEMWDALRMAGYGPAPKPSPPISQQDALARLQRLLDQGPAERPQSEPAPRLLTASWISAAQAQEPRPRTSRPIRRATRRSGAASRSASGHASRPGRSIPRSASNCGRSIPKNHNWMSCADRTVSTHPQSSVCGNSSARLPRPQRQEAEDAARSGRTLEQFRALAREQDQGNKITANAIEERRAALALEDLRKLPGPIRRGKRGPGGSDSEDAQGQHWDVKAFRSDVVRGASRRLRRSSRAGIKLYSTPLIWMRRTLSYSEA